MAKAYRLTQQQWDSLPSKVKAKFPCCGAMPYNSNYHLCCCIEAIKHGEGIKESVHYSYGAWTRGHSFDDNRPERIKDGRW